MFFIIDNKLISPKSITYQDKKMHSHQEVISVRLDQDSVDYLICLLESDLSNLIPVHAKDWKKTVAQDLSSSFPIQTYSVTVTIKPEETEKKREEKYNKHSHYEIFKKLGPDNTLNNYWFCDRCTTSFIGHYFTAHYGVPPWHCLACGSVGTLVKIDFPSSEGELIEPKYPYSIPLPEAKMLESLSVLIFILDDLQYKRSDLSGDVKQKLSKIYDQLNLLLMYTELNLHEKTDNRVKHPILQMKEILAYFQEYFDKSFATLTEPDRREFYQTKERLAALAKDLNLMHSHFKKQIIESDETA